MAVPAPSRFQRAWLLAVFTIAASCGGKTALGRRDAGAADAEGGDAARISQSCQWNPVTQRYDRDCVAAPGQSTDASPCDASPSCDPVSGGGCCAGKCALGGSSFACTASIGDRQLGEKCQGPGQCRTGLVCDDGQCLQYCRADTDCPAANGRQLRCLKPGLPGAVGVCGG